MNRILSYGLFAGAGLALCVADLSGGVFNRSSPPADQTARSTGPACPKPPGQTRRTWYLSSTAPDQRTARGGAGEIDPRPLVWVVDGAGDFRGCSIAFTHANMSAGNPVELAVFPWSHGYRKLLLDQTDAAHARAQGVRLAAKLLDRRREEPGRRMVIVAHSAGAAVALAAGDALPPDSIDRVFLLAPSVSTGYDIRPTMRAAREGVDVFCSKKDWVALGFVTRVVGTVDRHWSAAAGRHGFQLPAAEALTDPAAGRLRQHFWTPEVAWTGNTGGHYGTHAPGFIQAYLFPLIGVRLP
ncbi:MAG: hypothetical protein JWO38_7886 [Gemmataceae bacterium]|nr:hypothetical protein [Gemmataceae bacterium]